MFDTSAELVACIDTMLGDAFHRGNARVLTRMRRALETEFGCAARWTDAWNAHAAPVFAV